MFRIECCKGLRKCRVFGLAVSKHYKNVYLKITRCPKCRKLIVLIEKVDFNGKKTTIRRQGEEAYSLYERNLYNIIYEINLISKQSSKVSWTYYKTINSETLVGRYMDESGNAGERIYSPVKIVCA